jgi:hypothetical protein
VIIFHNQHESNHISMVFYFAVIIYDSIIISLTYCFLILALMLYVIATCKSLFFYFLFFYFKKIYQNMGQNLGSNTQILALVKRSRQT